MSEARSSLPHDSAVREPVLPGVGVTAVLLRLGGAASGVLVGLLAVLCHICVEMVGLQVGKPT